MASRLPSPDLADINTPSAYWGTARCACCGETKDVDQFYRSTRRQGGLHCYCIPCESAKSADNYRKRKPRKDAQNKAWYAANKEKRRVSQSSWQQENKEKVAVIQRKYGIRHPDRIAAKSMRRYAGKKRATPLWANTFFIEEIYALAELRTALTGCEWEVDHIVPLRSPNVCGLHVEHNLRVIPKSLNAHKHNRYWPGMPVDLDLSERRCE